MNHKRILFIVAVLAVVLGVSFARAEVLPPGGGSGAIFTTTPDGGIVNENVRYEDKRDVYLDGGPPPNAPGSAAGLEDGLYVFQVTDPPGKMLLSMSPAMCRVVKIQDGVIVNRMDWDADAEIWEPHGQVVPEPTYTVGNGKNGVNIPCHIDDDPPHPTDPGVRGASGQHDSNVDLDHGDDLDAIVVQLMPYGTTPNPGGVYKAWLTPLDAYQLVKGADIFDVPSQLPGGQQKPHACPDFCASRDPGFAPSNRYTKTDNFKVKLVPPRLKVFKFEDMDGNGEYSDPPDQMITGWKVTIEECPLFDGSCKSQDYYTPVSLTAAPGMKYIITEELPEGWHVSYLDVNGVPITPATSVEVTFGPSDYDTEQLVTFGNWEDSKKSGKKFHDQNANGVNDSEPGLGGWTIWVDYDGEADFDYGSNAGCTLDDDGEEPCAVTAGDGTYTISGIKPGTFKVYEVLKEGWTCSYPNVGTESPPVVSTKCYHEEAFTSGSEFADNDFGNWTTTTKSGKKFHDLNANGMNDSEPGLGGWTIWVDYDGGADFDEGSNPGCSLDGDGEEPCAVTAGDGTYTITGIVPGTFKVYEMLEEGWTCSYPNAGDSDKVYLDGQFVVKSNACFYEEAFKSGVPETGNDFGNWEPGKWRGFKCHDVNKNGQCDEGEWLKGGWTFYVDYNNDGELSAGEPSATTDSSGYATIDYIYPGTWNIREVTQSGWVCTGTSDPDHTAECFIEITMTSGKFIDDKDWFANRPLEGCTPGYWKVEQHFDSWWPPYDPPPDPQTALTGVFTIPAEYCEADDAIKLDNSYNDGPSGETRIACGATLHDALRFNGGDWIALLRHGAAAVLNAAHPDVAFGYTVGNVQYIVNCGLDSSCAEYDVAKALQELESANESMWNGSHNCPLN